MQYSKQPYDNITSFCEWNKKEIVLIIASLSLHKLETAIVFSYFFLLKDIYVYSAFQTLNFQTCKGRQVEYTACLQNTWEEKLWDDARMKWETSAFTTSISHNLRKRSPWTAECSLIRRTLNGSFCRFINKQTLACLLKWVDSAALCWLTVGCVS